MAKYMHGGYNLHGQLGINGSTSAWIPKEVTLPFKVISVAAGLDHTVVVSEDGQVYAWGGNSKGQLGINSLDYTDYNSYKNLVADLSNVKAVAAGGRFTLAITKEGKIYAWGYNICGQLGYDGDDTYKPIQIKGLSDINIISAEAGLYYSSALDDTGKVYTWGSNSYGQLGNDGISNSKPTQVMGLVNKKIMSIASGECHNVALTDDGNLFFWGEDYCGQNAIIIKSLIPLQITLEDKALKVKNANYNYINNQIEGCLDIEKSVNIKICLIDGQNDMVFTSEVNSDSKGIFTCPITNVLPGKYRLCILGDVNNYFGCIAIPSCGDLNYDGKTDSGDYQLLRRYLLKIITEFPELGWEKSGDIDLDGVIDTRDYIFLRKFLLGMVTKLPIIK